MFPLWFALLGGSFCLLEHDGSFPFCSFYSPLFGCFGLYRNWQGFIVLLYVQSIEHDETLANFVKQKHPAKGQEKERTKRKNSSPNQKLKKPKGVTKGQSNKLCSKALTSCKKHIKEKNGKKI
jgi:hypothetical protein